ncbi:unnamed protein product [Phaeothamnion confervicola]
MVYQGGIVAAVDSRASMGSFVGSSTTRKIIPVTNRILGTMAGGAADCSFWLRRLSSEVSFIFSLRQGEGTTVQAAARMLANVLHQGSGLDLSLGTMIMGCDNDGASIYYVDSEGSRIKGNYFSVGSGSTYAYGILDREYRYNMSTEEAVELGRRAVRHATFRDAMSGGFINVVHVDGGGWRQVARDDSGLLDVHTGRPLLQ